MQRMIRALYRRRSGAELVEFALVFPVLLFVIFAICQYGFLFWGYITIRNASAVGARQAIISLNNTNAISASAKGCVEPLLDSNLVSVVVNTTLVVDGRPATSVKVSYPFKIIIPFVVPPFTGAGSTNKTITATTIVQ
jgi:Flp pilus assembly protein TadG